MANVPPAESPASTICSPVVPGEKRRKARKAKRKDEKGNEGGKEGGRKEEIMFLYYRSSS